MQVNFYPEWDDPVLIHAAETYQRIWAELEVPAVRSLERVTGFRFKETQLNVLVFEGVSRSHPLILRASYPDDIKAACLVHELGHRLLDLNGLTHKRDEQAHVNVHKLLNLILFDVYVELFGEQQALEVVVWESNLRPSYEEC